MKSDVFILATTLLIMALFLISCKDQVEIECDEYPERCEFYDGTDGSDGSDGVDGQSAEAIIVELSVDRSLSWSDDNKIEVNFDGYIQIPESFSVPELTQNENGGWLDFIVGDTTLCFQGNVGKKTYSFKYKKQAGYSDGCDQNNEKDDTYTNFYLPVFEGDTFQIVPRAPRFNGIVVDFEFSAVGVK